MFRRSLDADRGMIFIFPTTEEHSFWMHNTLLALDMIFLDETRQVIGVVANAAPQTDTPQGWPPNTFLHDHVVRGVPSQNHGAYSVQVQGYFVFCSGQGIVSGACVPSWTSTGGDPLPFAETVNGKSTSCRPALVSMNR